MKEGEEPTLTLVSKVTVLSDCEARSVSVRKQQR